MARVKRGVTSHAKHKKVLKAVKGQWGRRKNTIRIAKQAMEKAMQYAYRVSSNGVDFNKKLCNMPIEIVELKKENLSLYGSKELTQVLDLKD